MKTFYHSSPDMLDGHILEPRTESTVNGKRGIYVFVSDDRLHALTYTVPKGIRLMNAHIDETGAQIMVLDSEEKIGDPVLRGGIYSFQSDDFEQVCFRETFVNQWVSTQPIDLQSASFIPIGSLNDLMRENIQIYQIGETPYLTTDSFYEKLMDPHSDLYGFMESALLNGSLRWLNQERALNPCHPFPAQAPETRRAALNAPSPKPS